MATMWLPTALALPWAIPAWWRRLRRRDPRYLLPLAWWLLVLVFFTLPNGKRDMYILPALPMMALALGPLLPGLLRRRGVRRVAFGFTALLSLASACWVAWRCGSAIPVSSAVSSPSARWRTFPRALAASVAAVGVCGVACLLWLGRARPIARDAGDADRPVGVRSAW